jgi:hypothetical protein
LYFKIKITKKRYFANLATIFNFCKKSDIVDCSNLLFFVLKIKTTKQRYFVTALLNWKILRNQRNIEKIEIIDSNEAKKLYRNVIAVEAIVTFISYISRCMCVDQIDFCARVHPRAQINIASLFIEGKCLD